MPAATPPALSEIVARNLVARRRATTDVMTGEALSQAGLARDVATLVGMPWTQSTVAAIETGRRQVSVVEIVALSMVLRTPLADLLDPGDETAVEISDGAYWTAEALRRVARGEVESLDGESDEGFGVPRETAEMMRSVFAAMPLIGVAANTLLDEFDQRWGLDSSQMSARQHRAIAYADGGVERDAAARIWRASGRRLPRIEPCDVAGAAWKLWKRSYAEERDRRVDAQAAPGAPERTRQALRGHVVRQLDRELLDEMTQVLGIEKKKARKR